MNAAVSSRSPGTDDVAPEGAQRNPEGAPLTFLVVDDETHLRLIVSHMLKAQGHRVLLAKDAAEARQLWEANAEQIHVVITDIKLPNGVSGFALARELAEKDPHVAIGFTSGFAGCPADSGIQLREGVNYLSKPFTVARLLAFVQSLLTQDPATTLRTTRKS